MCFCVFGYLQESISTCIIQPQDCTSTFRKLNNVSPNVALASTPAKSLIPHLQTFPELGTSPRFLRQLRAEKAARILCNRALLVGRLQPMLLAAREKLRLRALAFRRRLRGAVWTSRLAVNLMRQV